MIKNHILYNSFSDWQFKVAKAEGSYIWDDIGKKYIDFTSGWNVANLGWNHPEVNEAVAKQASKNVYAPMWTADSAQEEYAERLTNALPKPFDTLVRGTGGTESVEMATKIARVLTGRKKMIGFADTYHGQLYAAMAIGYRPKFVEKIAPLVPDFIQLEYPRTQETLENFLVQLEELLSKKDVAAVVTEAGIITGWGSVFTAPKGYLIKLREITKKYGTLLILDEVGTGFSRTGKLFALEFENVIPDMITLAKGISNGAAAIGTVAVQSNMINEAVFSEANLTSTFGWTPVACAAASKTLEVHTRDKVWEQSESKGKYLLETLQKELKGNPKVVDVRGLGMEIGLELAKEENLYSDVMKKAFDLGLHLIGDNESVIQIMPPLLTEKDVLDEGINVIAQSVK